MLGYCMKNSDKKAPHKTAAKISCRKLNAHVATNDLAQIRITTNLKKEAVRFLKSLNGIDYVSESVDICDVQVKCKTSQQVEAISDLRKDFQIYAQSMLPSPPKGSKIKSIPWKTPKKRMGAKSESVQVAASTTAQCRVSDIHAGDLQLASLFEDISRTKQDTIPIKRELLLMLAAFAAAFNNVISLRVFSAHSAQEGNLATHSQEEQILQTHGHLLRFASFLKAAEAPATSIHLTINHNLSVLVDGKDKNLNQTDKRRLFVLARLRDKEWFAVSEYSHLYGNNSGEPKKEFDQNNRLLAKKIGLPMKFWKSDVNQRAIVGINWTVLAPKGDMEQFLRDRSPKETK
jgi:hypothetical protein